VNVLLVPAHPGFPGQIPQSRKTVVCVCGCVLCFQYGLNTDSGAYTREACFKGMNGLVHRDLFSALFITRINSDENNYRSSNG